MILKILICCSKHPLDALKSLKRCEKMQCEKITEQLGLPLYTHQMLFDDSDVQQVREYVLGGGVNESATRYECHYT